MAKVVKQVSAKNLDVKTSAELLSYIINVTPELRGEIDLPVQGQSIRPIGKLIMDNPVYKNAFLNTCNIIGKTVITRNKWTNPWRKFTDKGTITYGQQVREIICDIANVYDYNNFVNRPLEAFKTVIPNVLNYVHEVNYQKFYKTTTSDEQMAMAFEREDLFSLIDEIVNSLYEGMEYDDFLVSKYILARRILDGTVTAIQIPNFNSMSDRDVVAFIKGYSNDLTFRSPDFNPAGLRVASSFENQFAIVTTKFDGKFSTNVLATSYFKNEAELKANMELCNGFGNFDEARLTEIFGKRDENGDLIENEYLDGYVPLTSDEKSALAEIPACILDYDFFQCRRYGTNTEAAGRKTEIFNPQTLRTNHFLHEWGIMSTSPFCNAIVFTQTAQGVTSVTVSPSTATISVGQSLQLAAAVVTTGFANKAVTWKVDSTSATDGVKISVDGKLTVPTTASVETITVTATSIYDPTVTGTATITVAENVSNG